MTSVHSRNATSEAVAAPEQYCSAPLLKVERSISDRFLKQSESSLNTFQVEQKLQRNLMKRRLCLYSVYEIFVLHFKYSFCILCICSLFQMFVLYSKYLSHISNMYSELQIFVPYSKNLLYVSNSCSLFQIFVLIAKYLS